MGFRSSLPDVYFFLLYHKDSLTLPLQGKQRPGLPLGHRHKAGDCEARGHGETGPGEGGHQERRGVSQARQCAGRTCGQPWSQLPESELFKEENSGFF